MKRLLSIGIIILFIGMSISSSTGFDAVEQSNIITNNGKTLYVGGSGPGNYSKIQDAIDNASDGDTVFVYDDSSPYYEEYGVTIGRWLNLIGEDKRTTIVKAPFVIKHHVVTISGFTIQSPEIGILIKGDGIDNTIRGNIINAVSVGVELHKNAHSNIISNNVINSETGIYLKKSMFSIISDNVINSVNGIILDGEQENCNNNTIYNNTITSTVNNSGNGITLKTKWVRWSGIPPWDPGYCRDNNVSNNIISKYENGIRSEYSSKNIIYCNTISRNKKGISIDSTEHYGGPGKILRNNISYNQDGINLETPGRPLIKRNIISNNHRGITGWADRIIIINNLILNNSKGIYVLLDSTIQNNQIEKNEVGVHLILPIESIISENNFENNAKHAFFVTPVLSYHFISLFQNWNGNYWGKPKFLPYVTKGRLTIRLFSVVIFPISFIPWINFDWHPAQEPYDI